MKSFIKKLILAIIVLSFLSLLGCNKPISIPMFYGEFTNAQRTSYKDVSGLKEIPSAIEWKYILTQADEVNWLTENEPTIEGNTAFLVSGSMMCAVNIDNGKEIWRQDYSKLSPNGVPSGFESDFMYSPVVYGDKIIIVGGFSARQYLFVLDRNTGEPIWKSDVVGGIQTEQCSCHPLVSDGKVYLAATNLESYEKNGSPQAGIYVWDVNTGKVLDKIFLESIAESIVGKYRSMAPASASLAQDGANIYGVTRFTNDSTYRTYIFCYNISTKKLTWFAPIGEEGFASPGQRAKITVDQDFIAICMVGDQWGSSEPQFFIKVFEKVSHEPLWQNITETNRELTPVLTISDIAIHDMQLYAMTMDKRFVCFDAKTGKEIWSFKDKDWVSDWWKQWNRYENMFRENEILITKDIVYFNVGTAIYAFDLETQQMLWRKLVEKAYFFINIMPVEKGLIVRYQDDQIGYDMPQKPSVSELWK